MLVLLLAATLLASPPVLPVPAARATSEAALLARFAWGALRNEPAAAVVDVYKWLFQATRGGEHAAPSEEAARRWLESEWATLGPPFPDEPLVVPLRPDGTVVRLNLRPYKAAGGDPEDLLRAFLSSAREFRPDPGLFVSAWRAFGAELAPTGTQGLEVPAFEALDREAERAGWPARHHGADYAAERKPAYRVLTGEEAARLTRAGEGTR